MASPFFKMHCFDLFELQTLALAYKLNLEITPFYELIIPLL